MHRRCRSWLSLDHLILQIEDKPGEESGGEVEYGHDSREEVGMSGGVVVRIVILRPKDPERQLVIEKRSLSCITPYPRQMISNTKQKIFRAAPIPRASRFWETFKTVISR